MSFPEDLLYSHDHTWVRIDGDIATVGITDYAQEILGEILSVELFPLDSTVEQGEPFGVIESMKVTTELISPMSGDIISVNDDLTDEVGILNSDPYDTGWMITIATKNLEEADNLLDAEEYAEYIDETEEVE
ncbi:MAG TPA: glycine cleavage system protein GcvH [Syntrophales bacterium]|nr:glycine cleavage system protein GcvH [Syntrophales bacterium]HPQ43283.1 glycine cleavage system protein GcvH [Syntrophales bacterium]